jgi:hypothetical protein
METKELTLVIPAELIPASVALGLAPPKLPSAEDTYNSALEIANSGLFDLAFAQKLVIGSKDDYKDALDLAKSLKGTIKRLEEDRKSRTELTDEYKKNTKGMYDIPIGVYKSGVEFVEKMAGGWNTKEQERIRLEQDRLDREAREREEKAAADERARVAKAKAEEDARVAREQIIQAEIDAVQENLERDAIKAAEEAGEGTPEHVAKQSELDLARAKAAEEKAERDRIAEQEKADREAKAQKERDEADARCAREQREADAQRAHLDAVAPKGFRYDWVPEIRDGEEGKVVRQYCTPDMVKIRGAVKSGLREGDPMAAGLRIYKKMIPTGRGGGSR